MTTVIIPAHNESAVIHKTLNCITAGDWQKHYDIIVVPNGCTDDTADIARGYAGVQVVETEVGSKSNAMNLGDKHAKSFPRIYLDADIETSVDSLVEVANVLKTGKTDLAAPAMEIDTSGCTFFVKGFYKVWGNLPYCKEQMIGAGFYALSEQGRAYFGDFPNLYSEDEYIRLLYPSDRRMVVKSAWFKFRPPSNLKSLIQIRSRHQRGNHQLRTLYPALWKRKEPTSGTLKTIISSPELWPWVPPFVVVTLITRANGYYQLKNIEKVSWDKDTSSREASAAAG